MRTLLICLLATMLCASPSLAASDNSGFSTPEEAVLAYVEAMREGDVNRMISTFAIEQYVDERDPQALLKMRHMLRPGVDNGLPASNSYARELAIAMRRADILYDIFDQYLYASWPYELGEPKFPFRCDADDVPAFLSLMSEETSAFASRLSELEFVGFADFESMVDDLGEREQRIFNMINAIYGYDERKEMLAVLKIGGEEYYLYISCALIGNRWYNANFGGERFRDFPDYARGLARVAECDFT